MNSFRTFTCFIPVNANVVKTFATQECHAILNVRLNSIIIIDFSFSNITKMLSFSKKKFKATFIEFCTCIILNLAKSWLMKPYKVEIKLFWFTKSQIIQNVECILKFIFSISNNLDRNEVNLEFQKNVKIVGLV